MATLAQPYVWPVATVAHQQDDADSARPKRAKIALACQRCKKRKQKCDGGHPCSKCSSHHTSCEYVVPQKPMPFGKNQYIGSLERRVAELETLLTVHGINDLDNDHWAEQPHVHTAAPTHTAQKPLDASPSSGSSRSDPDQHDGMEQQDDADPVVSVLRSLSLDVNGSGYIGASSHIALGKLLSFLRLSGDASRDSIPRSQTPPMPHGTASVNNDERPIELNEVPDHCAEKLFTGFRKHIATRFPVLYSVWAHELHMKRKSLYDVFEKSILHLVYATAGRFLETTGDRGTFAARRHYHAATKSLDVILGFNDIRTVQMLMLMAIYCLRDSMGPGAWTYSRTALLIAIDLGLHRQTRRLSHLTIESELRKRLFWACYSFDRQISIPMGRPFGISDRDIDVGMPLDINEDCTEATLRSSGIFLSTVGMSTSLTPFLRIIELRKIESEIQQTIYRVDSPAPVEDVVVDRFLAQLMDWKARIPQDTRYLQDNVGVPYDGYDYYLVFYYKCQRLLLYPSITKRDVELRFLKECARACSGVCGAYKRLHQSLAVGYSSMAVQTVFMAGLTLTYCIWRSPDEIFDMTTSNGIHDCSLVLFVMAERVPAAKKYRNSFETIRQGVIDHIAEHPRPHFRTTIPGLTADLAPSGTGGDDLVFDDCNYDQLSRIMADMAGESWLMGTNSVLPERNLDATNDFSNLLDSSHS